MPATLYLVPNLLSDTDASRALPVYNAEILKDLKYYIVETPKNARLLLKKYGLKTPFDDMSFYILNEHTKGNEIDEIIAPLYAGNSMGIISDAGYPAIADPGEIIIRLAHQRNIRVVPLSGPNSIFLALAASGMNSEQFTFHGYLPVKQPDRSKKIKELEETTLKTGYTQIFIETPYRNQSMISDLVKTVHPNTLICIAADINSDKEMIQTKTAANWQKLKPDFNKKPVVFLIGK